MSDNRMDDQLPDGDGKLGNDEGPADSGAGQGLPGEHDGGADGGAGGGDGAGSGEEGDLTIVSDTDAYASTEPLPLEEQSPAITPDGAAGSGDADAGADEGAEGPADSGAGDQALPGHSDGGGDGGAEGPADSGAGDPGTPDEHDGGADGGADASR